MIGLNSAINRYREQNNALFYTYAKTCIERRIISTVIASNRNKNKILNESLSLDDEETSLFNFIKDSTLNPEKLLLDVELEEDLLFKIKSNLTDFEDQVFTLMISGFKYKEIAEILGKDNKSIDNAIQRLKAKIKKIISND